MIIRHLSIDCAYINKVLEPITQREHGVTEFEIEVKNHGADIDLSECTLATYYGLKPDEHKVGVECRVDKDKGLIYLPLYLQMTTAEGVLKGIVELQFPEGNVRFSGVNFKVSFAPDDTKIESTDDFNILENFIFKPTTDGVVGQVLSIDNGGNTIWRTLKEFDGDYAHLSNRPSINGVELNGDKSLEDLNIKQTYTADDISFADGETFQQKFNNGELNGKTPVKGVDYFTAEDKTEFTAEVTESLKPELAKKQDKLTAGENITISDDGTISVTNGVTAVEEALKTATADLTTVKSEVETARGSSSSLNARLNGIDSFVSNKAEKSTVSQLSARMQSAETSLAGKANATDVTNALKSKEDNLNKVSSKTDITDSKTNYPSIEYLDAYYYKANELYSAEETDELLGNKANVNSVYSKTESDKSLGNKADKVDVANQFSELKGDLDEIDDLFLKKELIVNLSSFKDESTGEYKNAGRYYYIPANNIVGITPDNNYACIPIELKAGTYSVRNINPHYSFYISNRQAVRFGSAESSFISTTFELPIDTTVYVTVRVVSPTNGHKTVAIASGDTIPDDISTLGIFSFDTFTKLDSVAKLEEKIPTLITVKKDGTGDFSTLKEAIDYSRSHSNLTIEVYEGTYDLIEEFGSDYFENLGSASSNEGLHLGNNVHIIFSSNSKVICNYEGDNANVHKYFSPFTCSANGNHKGFTLENLDLECSNVRYAIHDEVLSQKGRYVNKYKNCRVYIDNTSNGDWSNRQCIGGGLGGNGYIEIDSCYFESVATTSKPNSVGIVSYHCGNGTEDDNYCSKVTIKNSYFANEDTVRCSYYGNQTTMSTVTVNNCSLGRLPYCGLESTQYTTVNMKLIEFNNTVRAS